MFRHRRRHRQRRIGPRTESIDWRGSFPARPSKPFASATKPQSRFLFEAQLIGGEASPSAPQETRLGDKTAKPVFSSRLNEPPRRSVVDDGDDTPSRAV
jgi:hypothetical protein